VVSVGAGGRLMDVVYQLSAFFRRDWRLARSAPFGFAWQVAAIIFATPTLYYLGRLIPRGTPSLTMYGGDYFTFAVVGIAFSSFFASVMGACAAAVRQEQLAGTLDVLLTVPAPPSVLALGLCLWPVTLAAAQTVLYIVLGILMFHIGLARANVAGAAVIVALTAVLSGALGLLAAAFVLLFRRTEPLTGAMVGIGAVLGGVFYPPEILPARAQFLAQFVPLTPALRGLRLAVVRGADFTALASPVVVLLLWCGIAVPGSMIVARAALAEARRSGIADAQG
jgi:ABC-2 type transport system permease protein